MENSITKSIEAIQVDPFEETPPSGALYWLIEFLRMIPAIGFAAGFVGVMLFLSALTKPSVDQIGRTIPNPAPNPAMSAPAPASPTPVTASFPTPKHQ